MFCGAAQHGTKAMEVKLAQKKQAAPKKKSTPKLATIPRKHLCARAIWTFFFSHLAQTSILLFFLIAIITISLVLDVGTGVTLGVIFLSAYVLLLYVFSVLDHHSYYYEVNESAFQKEHGIIHKTNVTIPFNRIQNVNIIRSMSDRMLGLARIDIETAGSSQNGREVAAGSRSSAEGHLPGVTLKQAQEIHDLLIERFSGFQER